MNHNQHPESQRLAEFALGQIAPTESEPLERHVATCDECCRHLAAVGDDRLVDLARDAVAAFGPVADTRWNDTDSVAETGAEEPHDCDLQPPIELRDHPRYQIIEPIGSGGMGVVFKAEHRLMKRVVALKVINRRLTSSANAVARFRKEVQAAASLSHPNIVTTHDAEQAGDVHFLVMEHVEGTSLDRLVAEKGPLPVSRASEFTRQAALGLQHAHERGMVHRDIKPQNLMVDSREAKVEIIDFGLARLLSEQLEGASGLTKEHTVLGTPDFIAPEQAHDTRSADVRSDIYSLGCTLYYLLAARVPFPVDSSVLKLSSHMLVEPKPLSTLRDDVPQELAGVLERMMAKDPADRFQTAVAVAEALAPFAESRRAMHTGAPRINVTPVSRKPKARSLPSPRTRKLWIALAAVVAACMLAGALAHQFWPTEPSDNLPVVAAAADVFVLFVLPPDGVWYEDFGPVYDTLKQHGVDVKVASMRTAISVDPQSGGDGRAVEADMLIEDVIVSHYDVIVFCGGYMTPFSDDASVHRLVHQHLDNNMFVAAICGGQRVLVSAGVLEGIEAARPPFSEEWEGSDGVRWLDQPLVESGHIITAADPDSADLFAVRLLKLLKPEIQPSRSTR